MQREQARGQVVDPDLHLVDPGFVLQDLLRQPLIAVDQRPHAPVHGGLHQAGHFEQSLLQVVEFFLKVAHSAPPTRTGP